ncbi:MAG TPA: PH domain-containing protein [Micromonosporaceae bacterium]|nr:PH domain-containing protein [Micromonosporaceae bacterium]
MSEPALRSGIAMTVDAQARKARKVAYVAAGLVAIVFTAVAFTLHGRTESGRSEFHIEDQIAMIVLGVLAAAGILMFTRPRIIADRQGVRVRNLLAWKYFPWDVIAAVRFDRGSPWVALDLENDDVISVMAVQAADKDYAVDTVRTLRRLLDASRDERDAGSQDREDGATDAAAAR